MIMFILCLPVTLLYTKVAIDAHFVLAISIKRLSP